MLRSRRLFFALLALIAPLTPGSATAQVIHIDSFGDFEMAVAMEGVTRTEAQPAIEKPQDPSGLFKAFQKLKLDRRPSRILEAWAQPDLEPLPEEPPVEEALPEESSQAADQEAVDTKATDGAAGALAPTAAELAEGPIEEATPDAGAAATDVEEAAEVGATEGATEVEGAEDASTVESKSVSKEREKELEEWRKKRQERELEILQRDVTLGRWERVAAFLARFEGEEPRSAYEHLLGALLQAPPTPQYNQVPRQFHEKNSFSTSDVLALARMAPGEDGLTQPQAALLAPLITQALAEGHVVEELVLELTNEVAKPDDTRRLGRRQAAWILSAVGQDVELGAFLPRADEAEGDSDREALNLLARHHLALYSDEPKVRHLEDAWHVTQAALAVGEIGEDEKREALRRAVELATRIRDEFGEQWLSESFTERPERGREVLATMGGLAALGFLERAKDTAFRAKALALQKTAVDALLDAAPERAEAWRASLNRLAANWLAEAQHSHQHSQATALGPRMERDAYGNVFYYNWSSPPNQPVTPLEPDQLLDQRPQGRWLELLDDSVRPRFAMVAAQLYLKVNEEAQAFPYIEQLCATHPENAVALAEEFLRVWTRNHDPNASNRYTSSYMFMYGFDQRSSGIPLTRSKQERNLAELGEWVARLRLLPIFPRIDEELFVQAFTQCHSAAEVYRLEKLEAVFGDIADQDPDAVAGLVQKMRTNLGDVWRLPSTQEDAKTKRRQKDIEREVLAGYALARETLGRVLAEHPEHWRLALAEAALSHDENNYRQDVAQSQEFARTRLESLARFERAAELYLDQLDDLAVDDETAEAFEFWFYAGLGAVDLKHLNERTRPDPATPVKVRDALESLVARPNGAELYERHLAKFASSLVTRLQAVSPACKFRYLDAGFEIVGDHPAAQEARKVLEYYRDLVHEIQLVATVDGSDTVGWEAPFGLRVDLRHTKEIERESGGFAKYLQNQNAGTRYYFNYGRPLEDYRDKFQDSVDAALGEHFEILSVTFNHESVTSKAVSEYGWRVTPYAYLLLQARGPQVDQIPPLQLDLDFMDTSGYAVLPIASAPVPIDASVEPDAARPYTELGVTQILDERRAAEGELVLEIKASAKGLVPDLDKILTLSPTEFTVAGIDDQGVSVLQFDEEEQIEPLSERLWTVSLVAKQDLDQHPEKFEFATPAVPVEEVIYQRYADADLVTTEPEVKLGELYGDPGFPWARVLIPLAVGLVALSFWLQTRRAPPVAPAARHRLPDPLTPFSVLALLRAIEDANALPEATRVELHETIAALERHYFSQDAGEAPDLRAVAERWARLAG